MKNLEDTGIKKLIKLIKSKFESLAKVATSGSYNDLSDKPTIPSVGNGRITIKQGGIPKGTFTVNQSGATAIELDDNDTHYTSKNVVGSSANDTNNTTTALTNGNVYLNSVENGSVTSSHKIKGIGGTTVSTDTSGNIVIKGTTGTSYSAGTGLSLSGTTFNHSNSVTAGTAQGDASKTLTFGGTFTVPTVTYDAQGHVTGKGTTTMTMPANPNTDTKNTAGSTDTSSKIFLIGAKSQSANPQTYSHDTAYVGTDGCLYSGGAKVSVNGHTHGVATTTSSGFLSSTDKSKLDNLQVGGRNLYTQNATFKNLSIYSAIKIDTDINGFIVTCNSDGDAHPRIKNIIEGKTWYTVSAYIKADTSCTMAWDVCDYSLGSIEITTEYQYFKGTVYNPRSDSPVYDFVDIEVIAQGANNKLYFKNFKVEKGTMATDWTPAPEDTTYSTGTDKTAGLTKLYNGVGSNTDGTMTQLAIGDALAGKAGAAHTHTKSQITDFPTSLKNPNGLRVQVNGDGASEVRYDGSVAKTINLVAGDNVTLTQKTSENKVTIAAKDTTYSTGTDKTAGLTKLYSGLGSNTDGTMTQLAIDDALAGKAGAAHTHTKSQITDFPTSLKNPNGLRVQVNGDGASEVRYDGSVAKTINIKAGSNITITSDSSGNITISSTASAGSVTGDVGTVVYENTSGGLYCDGSTANTKNNSKTIEDSGFKYKRLRFYCKGYFGLVCTDMPLDRECDAYMTGNDRGKRYGGVIFPTAENGNIDSTGIGPSNHMYYELKWRVEKEAAGWRVRVFDSGWFRFNAGIASDTNYTNNSSTAVAGTDYIQWNQRHNNAYCIYKIVAYTV